MSRGDWLYCPSHWYSVKYSYAHKSQVSKESGSHFCLLKFIRNERKNPSQDFHDTRCRLLSKINDDKTLIPDTQTL